MLIVNDEKKVNEYLRKYDFSGIFSDVEIYRSGFKIVKMERKSFLFMSEEQRRYLYFLVEGKFSVYATDENGNQMLVRYCDSFICLGDMEFLGYSEPSNAIEMDSNCTFLALDMSLFRDKLLNDMVFIRYIARALGEKLNYFAKMQFHDRSITSSQKVVSHIIERAGESLFYKENIRKAAAILSISYRHYHRILSELVDEGILSRRDGGYQIVHIGLLEKKYFE